MKRILFLSLALLAGAAQAESGQKDVKTLAQPCLACHGEGGAKPIVPTYPILAGQYANYLAESMQQYKQGKRKNAVMQAQVQNLTDEDIRLLSQYFQAQESPLYTPSLNRHQQED